MIIKNKLGGIIKQLLKECHLDETELSNNTGIPKSTISRIINHKCNPTIDTLIPIAHFFNITLSELIGETKLDTYGVSENLLTTKITSTLPVITLNQVDEYLYHEMKIDKFIISEISLPQKSFAILIDSDNYQPTFHQKTLVLVNIKMYPNVGDIVLVKNYRAQNATFRKLIIHDGVLFFSLLDSYTNKFIKINPEDVIYGVVVEQRIDMTAKDENEQFNFNLIKKLTFLSTVL